MITYEELVSAANAYCRKKGYYCSGEEFLSDVMTDGEGGGEKDTKNGISKSWFFMSSKHDDFCSKIVQYDRVIYDDGGEICDYEPVGYEID